MNSITIKQKHKGGIISETQFHAMKLKNLQSALIEGEQSDDAGELDMQLIKGKARKALREKT